MLTRICTKCGIEKPITDFNWRNKEKGTLRSDCKQCHSDYIKKIYQNKRIAVGQIKQSLQCSKCGYNEYPVALDFHHLNPKEKDTSVARMLANNYTLDKIMDEINKCICLCANCHRIFHFLEKEENMTIEQFLA